MASIELIKPIDVIACAQREVLDVIFRINGELNCKSTSLYPSFKFKNGIDDIYDLQIINIMSSSNEKDYDAVDNILVSDINKKIFKVRVKIPEHDDDGVVLTNMEYLKCYFYLDGNDKTEIGNSLKLQSNEFHISTTRNRYIQTKPVRTNKVMNNIYIKLILEEIICEDDDVKYTIEVTNNPFDDKPKWEDISDLYNNGLTASINNTDIRTEPGISVRVYISKKDNSLIKIKNICMTYY